MERKLIVRDDAETMYVALKELYVSFWPSDTGQRDRQDRDLPGGTGPGYPWVSEIRSLHSDQPMEDSH